MPHIQVADVAASVQRAVDRGGSALMHVKDNDGKSQWAVLLDPNQAAFGIMPVIPPEAMPDVSSASSTGAAAVGRIFWLDLTVPEATTTRDFYRSVIGWSVREVEMQDGDTPYNDYHMLGEDGNAMAAICHARGVNSGLPPVWMIYLSVGDLAESVRRVDEEGGRLIKMMGGEAGEHEYAVVQDPVGVYFAIVAA
jgi:uncharacterized protein